MRMNVVSQYNACVSQFSRIGFEWIGCCSYRSYNLQFETSTPDPVCLFFEYRVTPFGCLFLLFFLVRHFGVHMVRPAPEQIIE